MDWDRVDAARRQARRMLLFAGLLIILAVFLSLAKPATMTPLSYREDAVAGIPVSLFSLALGFAGMFIGLGLMWLIYRAPTRFDEPRWRYRDR
jgi:NADH:ubiquinone oxidoreductase subunit K